MVPFLRFLRRFGRRSARYFILFQKSVAEKNWIAIRRVSVCSLALLTGYFVMALFVFRQTILLATYGAFILPHIGLVAYTRRKKGVPSARQAETVCLAYIVLIMTFITIVTVFPYSGRPAIFFSLFCLLMKQNLNIKRRIIFIGCIFMLCFLVVLFVAIRVVLSVKKALNGTTAINAHIEP